MQNAKLAVSELEREPGRQLGDVHAVKKKLDVSDRHVYRLSDADKMPPPIKLVGAVRWDLQVIDESIRAGCPPVDSGRRASR